MITWAALIVLQGIEGGVGEDNGKQFLSHYVNYIYNLADLPMVQDLLNTLRMTQEPITGIRHQLANQLEASFQNIHTPPAPISPVAFTNNIDGLGWSIFDEMSLQYPMMPWPNDPMQ